MKSTKSEISKIFAELRKFGFLVFNFNSDRKLNRGKMTGFVDHLIIGRNAVWLIEVKIGRDKISNEQFKLRQAIQDLDSTRVQYRCCGDYKDDKIQTTALENAKMIRDQILEIG